MRVTEYQASAHALAVSSKGVIFDRPQSSLSVSLWNKFYARQKSCILNEHIYSNQFLKLGLLFFSLCVGEGTCIWPGVLLEVDEQLSGVSCLLPACGSQASNSDPLAWQQVPLPIAIPQTH